MRSVAAAAAGLLVAHGPEPPIVPVDRHFHRRFTFPPSKRATDGG